MYLESNSRRGCAASERCIHAVPAGKRCLAGAAARTAWPTWHGVPDAFVDIQSLGNDVLLAEDTDSITPTEVEPVDLATPTTESPIPSDTSTAMFELRVRLNNDVEPVAREFGGALIENLRTAMQKAFTAHGEELQKQLAEAQTHLEAARRELENLVKRSMPATVEDIRLDPADAALYKQLEQIVDLSALNQQMPAIEAFGLLQRSVQPPLNLVVLWRDLLENAQIEPTTPIEHDGSSNIRLGTALESLLSAMTDPLATSDDYRLDYVVSGGVVTVATRLGLPQERLETRVYELPPLLRMTGQSPEIAAMIRETIGPRSWLDSDPESGDGTIASSPDGRLVVSQSYGVHKRIEELLAKLNTNSLVTLPLRESPEVLMERMESLLAYRTQLEEELDRLQERQGQLSRERDEREKQAMQEALRVTASDLGTVKMEVQAIYADAVKTEPNASKNTGLQRTIQKIEQCINRCDKAVPRGTFTFIPDPLPLPEEWREERTMASRIAAKQRDLRAVSRRIEDIQRVLAGPRPLDIEFSHIRQAAERYEQADIQVHELENRIAMLRPCALTIIGGIE